MNHPSGAERNKPVLSLFCGPGGLDLGFEAEGFVPLLALDKDPSAVATYNANRPSPRPPAIQADLATVSPRSLLRLWRKRAGSGVPPAGIIGGPPCQAFSISNAYRFDGDPRAKLPLAYSAILAAFNDEFGLDFFVLENVAGLGSPLHRESLERFLKAFENAGFSSIYPFYLDALHFGVPQHRRRMFIAGFNRSRFPDMQFLPPEGASDPGTVASAIRGLPEPLRFAKGIDPAASGLHANHWCMNPKSTKFSTDGAMQPGVHHGRSFRRLRWEAPSWTVAYGHREVHVHPDGHRRLSVYESMLIQGFPKDGYILKGTLSDQYRLVSDAVPPPLARALAKRVSEALCLYPQPVGADLQYRTNGHALQLGMRGVQTVAPKSTSA